MSTQFQREVYHTFGQRREAAQELIKTSIQLTSGDWIPLQVAIENWPGIDTSIDLVFRTQTDWAFPTDFTLDNVQLTTTCQ